jgi:hypothetical protein
MPLLLNGETRFSLNLSPKKIKFEDTTDYVGQSITPSDVVGCLTFTGPSGVFYNNTNFAVPDILPGTTDFLLKNLPINSQNNAIQGSYTVDYRIRISNNYTVNVTNTNEITISSVDLTSVLVPGFSFQILDGLAPGTYIVDSVSFLGGNTIVNTTISLGGIENGVSMLFYTYASKLFNYEFCYDTPVVQIDPSIDCDCSVIVSRDITNYNIKACGNTIQPSVLNRVHVVNAPLGEGGNPVAPDVSSSLPTVTVTPIWTKTWTTTITTFLEYVLPTGLIVEMTAYGQDEYMVDCAEGLCCVYSCMANLRNKYELYLQTNPSRAAEFFPKLFRMTTAWMLYSAAHSCGDFSNKAKYLSEIINIAKSENCECCDGDDDGLPVQVVPLCGVSAGSGDTVVVTSCGNGIEVTSTTVGGTTTYNVCLDLSILNGNIASYIAANPSSLGSLSDVTITSVQAGQTLVWNGTQWVNTNLLLNDLGNVTAPSPIANQYLMWNGSTWIPTAVPVTYSKAFLIDSFTTPQARSTTGEYNNLAITLPLGTGNNIFATNGDVIEAEALFTLPSQVTPVCGFSVGGNYTTLRPFLSGKGERQLLSKLTLVRISATSVFWKVEHIQYLVNETSTLNSSSMYSGTLSVSDLTTTGLPISPVYLSLAPSGTATCQYSQYKAYKK